MNFLNSWIQGIVIAVIVATIIQMIMPNGNNKKYIKVLLGVYILFNIVSPIINKFNNSKFEIPSISDFTKQDNNIYEVSSSNLEKSNKNQIKQIYISNLKNDIKAKLEEKDYKVNSIEIHIDNLEEYTIKDISLSVRKKKEESGYEEDDKDRELNSKKENRISINEIEKVEIQVSDNKEEIIENSNITEFDKNKIKSYLSTTYEIKEENIIVY